MIRFDTKKDLEFYDNLLKEKHRYKQALLDIKEYIEKHRYSNMIMARDGQFGINGGKELLDIVNKALKEKYDKNSI